MNDLQHKLDPSIQTNMNVRKKAIDSITLKGDIYLFGIWSGVSARDTSNYLIEKNVDYHYIFGFDSFVGFPKEDNQSYHVKFKKGNYSSVKLYKTTMEKTIKIIYDGVDNEKLRLI